MKKFIALVLTLICVFMFASCDIRVKLSAKKCNELYSFVVENFTINDNDVENEFLYYDYSKDLLLINKQGQFFSNKNADFFETYNYVNYIKNLKYIVNNFEPISLNGWKVNTKVKYFISAQYDNQTIINATKLNINYLHLGLYENSNIEIEAEISNGDQNYQLGVIVGNIDLASYQTYNVKEIQI